MASSACLQLPCWPHPPSSSGKRPMDTTAYGGKGQGKGKGSREGRIGQRRRGMQGGERPMGTTTYGSKGPKGKAANGNRPIGAASCRREQYTKATCQTPRFVSHSSTTSRDKGQEHEFHKTFVRTLVFTCTDSNTHDYRNHYYGTPPLPETCPKCVSANQSLFLHLTPMQSL